jgi:hypothetical protein
MTLTRPQAEHLAAFLHAIRPDWYGTETVTALGEAARRTDQPDAYQIGIAAIRCAANHANGTPAHIPRHGHHWAPWPDEPTPTPTPPKIVTCEHCGGYITDTTRDLHIDRACMTEHQTAVYQRGRAAVDAELAAARQHNRQETI